MNFGPPFRPRARAAARPSWVRSTIRSCSNSAIAASMWKKSRPPGVVVSMPWDRARRPMPRAWRSSATCLRVADRPAQAVQLGDHQGVAGTQVGQRFVQRAAVGQGARRVVGEHLLAAGGTGRRSAPPDAGHGLKRGRSRPAPFPRKCIRRRSFRYIDHGHGSRDTHRPAHTRSVEPPHRRSSAIEPSMLVWHPLLPADFIGLTGPAEPRRRSRNG